MLLTAPQFVIQRLSVSHQLAVRALLRHPPPVQHQDLVTVDHGAQSVCDDYRGPALGGLVEGPHDGVLGDGVQAGGGLVKHQDGRVLQNGPGYCLSLLLPS